MATETTRRVFLGAVGAAAGRDAHQSPLSEAPLYLSTFRMILQGEIGQLQAETRSWEQTAAIMLKDVGIARVNQVWSTDVTYIRLAQGFCYLVAVMDWYSRFVLSWSLVGDDGDGVLFGGISARMGITSNSLTRTRRPSSVQ